MIKNNSLFEVLQFIDELLLQKTTVEKNTCDMKFYLNLIGALAFFAFNFRSHSEITLTSLPRNSCGAAKLAYSYPSSTSKVAGFVENLYLLLQR